MKRKLPKLRPFNAKTKPSNLKEYEKQVDLYIDVYTKKFSSNDPEQRVPTKQKRIKIIKEKGLNLNLTNIDWAYVQGEIKLELYIEKRASILNSIKKRTFNCKANEESVLLSLQENSGCFTTLGDDEKKYLFENVIDISKGEEDASFKVSFQDETKLSLEKVEKPDFFVEEFMKMPLINLGADKAILELRKRVGSNFETPKRINFLTHPPEDEDLTFHCIASAVTGKKHSSIEIDRIAKDSKIEPYGIVEDDIETETLSDEPEPEQPDSDSEEEIVETKLFAKKVIKKTGTKKKENEDIEMEDQNVLEVEEPEDRRPEPRRRRKEPLEQEEEKIYETVLSVLQNIYDWLRENKGIYIVLIVAAVVAVILCIGVFILVISLIFGSLETVPMFKYGVLRNTITNATVSDKIYKSGLYWVGPASAFLLVPAIATTVDFSSDEFYTSELQELRTRSLDGVLIDIEISYQYILDENTVYDIFNLFVQRYDQFFIDVSVEVINDVVSTFKAIDFFKKRSVISDNIELNLRERFNQTGVKLLSLQLNDVIVGTLFYEAILEKEFVKFEIEKKKTEQIKDVETAKIDFFVAEIQKNKTIILADALADATKIRKTADSEYEKVMQNARTVEMEKTKNEFGFNNTEFYKYKYLMEIYNGKKTFPGIVNMRTPKIINVP